MFSFTVTKVLCDFMYRPGIFDQSGGIINIPCFVMGYLIGGFKYILLIYDQAGYFSLSRRFDGESLLARILRGVGGIWDWPRDSENQPGRRQRTQY